MQSAPAVTLTRLRMRWTVPPPTADAGLNCFPIRRYSPRNCACMPANARGHRARGRATRTPGPLERLVREGSQGTRSFTHHYRASARSPRRCRLEASPRTTGDGISHGKGSPVVCPTTTSGLAFAGNTTVKWARIRRACGSCWARTDSIHRRSESSSLGYATTPIFDILRSRLAR
jgi:hypothetical protein